MQSGGPFRRFYVPDLRDWPSCSAALEESASGWSQELASEGAAHPRRLFSILENQDPYLFAVIHPGGGAWI